MTELEQIQAILDKMIENRWITAQHGGTASARATTQHVELMGVKLLLTDPEYRARIAKLYDVEVS